MKFLEISWGDSIEKRLQYKFGIRSGGAGSYIGSKRCRLHELSGKEDFKDPDDTIG